MARNWNGGSDEIHWVIPDAPNALGCAALRMKSTQATANVLVAAKWNSSSRNGWGLLLNDTANKITAQGWGASSVRVNIHSTTSVNDGNWHHIAFNYNRNNGGSNQLYVDGVQEASANSSSDWNTLGPGFWLELGHHPSFWATLVGDLCEVAEWQGFQLSADEIAAMAKDFAPPAVRKNGLSLYAPLVRDTRSPVNNDITVVGTTVTDHPRVIGGMV
jgi:hypothetical protein